MAMRTKFYEYVPPPMSPPNPVAEWMAGYLQMRTPYTLAKLKAADPAARDEYLAELAKKEADLLGQYATAQREAARLATEMKLSADESLRESIKLQAVQAQAMAQTEVANVNAAAGYAEKRIVGAAGEKVLGRLQAELDRWARPLGGAEIDPTARRGFEEALASVAQDAARMTNPLERDAVMSEANRLVQGYTGVNAGPGKNLMGAAVQTAFSTRAPPELRMGGVPSYQRMLDNVVSGAQQLRAAAGPPVVSGGKTSSSSTVGTSGRTPSSSPAPRTSAEGAGSSAPTGDSASQGPQFDMGTDALLQELERTRAERSRVLSEDPRAKLAAYDSAASQLFKRRVPPQVRPERAAGPAKERAGDNDVLDKTGAAVVNLVRQLATKKPKEETEADRAEKKRRRKERMADELVFQTSGQQNTGGDRV